MSGVRWPAAQALILMLLTLRADAQIANPLDEDGRKPGGGGVVAQNGDKLDAPSFIKPGARLIYTALSTLDPKPGVRGNTDGGKAQHDIVAVLPDRILARVNGFAQSTDGKEFFSMNTAGATVTAKTINAGNSLWMPKKQLDALVPVPGMEVNVGQWPLNGKNYEAVIIKFNSRENTTVKAYDKATGLLLSEAAGSGDFRRDGIDNGGLNRQAQRNTQFNAYRVLDLPWNKADLQQPAWARKVRSLTYRGAQRFIDNPGLAVPITSEITFSETGENWAIGTIKVSVPNTPPTESNYVQGPGSTDPFWISPQALRDLRAGVIDTDPTLGTTISYDGIKEGRLGKLAIFTHASGNRTQVRTLGYDTEDGALRFIGNIKRDLNMAMELELVGRN